MRYSKYLKNSRLMLKIKQAEGSRTCNWTVGKEYCNRAFSEFLKPNGIGRRLNITHTSKQNGMAERYNSTLMDMTRCLLLQLDRYPNKDKLELRSKRGIFVGYAEQSKAHRIWLLEERRVDIASDVKFTENLRSSKNHAPEDPFVDEFNGTTHRKFIYPTKKIVSRYESSEAYDSIAEDEADPSLSENDLVQCENRVEAKRGLRIDCGRPWIIRTGLRGRPKKEYHIAGHTETIEEESHFAEIPLTEPTAGPDSTEWQHTMATELKSILKYSTWTLVDRPENGKVIAIYVDDAEEMDLKQQGYINDILRCFEMSKTTSIAMLLEIRTRLTKAEGNLDWNEENFSYRELEAMYLRRFITELGFNALAEIIVYCDSNGAGKLAEDPVFHARAKHSDARHRSVRQVVEEGLLEVRYAASDQETIRTEASGLSETARNDRYPTRSEEEIVHISRAEHFTTPIITFDEKSDKKQSSISIQEKKDKSILRQNQNAVSMKEMENLQELYRKIMNHQVENYYEPKIVDIGDASTFMDDEIWKNVADTMQSNRALWLRTLFSYFYTFPLWWSQNSQKLKNTTKDPTSLNKVLSRSFIQTLNEGENDRLKNIFGKDYMLLLDKLYSQPYFFDSGMSEELPEAKNFHESNVYNAYVKILEEFTKAYGKETAILPSLDLTEEIYPWPRPGYPLNQQQKETKEKEQGESEKSIEPVTILLPPYETYGIPLFQHFPPYLDNGYEETLQLLPLYVVKKFKNLYELPDDTATPTKLGDDLKHNYPAGSQNDNRDYGRHSISENFEQDDTSKPFEGFKTETLFGHIRMWSGQGQCGRYLD
ncbi:hypothetical protein KM043_013405 [Ampulex compressa]|nr:hypothetical protein KM043_013405 [Ampulex compressa]